MYVTFKKNFYVPKWKKFNKAEILIHAYINRKYSHHFEVFVIIKYSISQLV